MKETIRVVKTTTGHYRVQYKTRFLWFTWWRYYKASANKPYTYTCIVEFDTPPEADRFAVQMVERELESQTNHSRLKVISLYTIAEIEV